MFCAPRLIFGDNEGVGSCFHVLRSRTRFRQYWGRRVPFKCFARPDSFSAVSTASGPVLMFCALGLVFSGTEGFATRFHVLCARTHFRGYRGRRVTFSCFALTDTFSAPGLVFDSTECVGSRFHVLLSRTHFRRSQGHRVPFQVLRARTRFRRNRGCSVPFSCSAFPD
jgi:hypothetical protein